MNGVRVVLLLLLCLCLLCSLAPSSARKPLFRAARDARSTGMYIIVLKPETNDDTFEGIRRKAVSLSNDKRLYGSVKTVEKAFTLKLNAIALEKIRSWPSVKHVEEEQMAFGSQDPNLPWHLDRIDQEEVQRDYQYSPYNNGEGVDVYVLDTGINYDHTEFERRAKYGGYDPVDEYYGESQMGRDCQGHGTHVSSLAGGKTYGTAKRVNLYSVRVLDCSNFAPWSVVLDGMDYVAKLMKERKRPMIVVMSLGGAYQPSANEAVQALHSMGVVVVVAAGNGKVDACKQSPSSSEYAITVGGSNKTDNLYWKGSGTNYGRCIDIFAPGESILGANYSCANCTMYLSGTSMSTPMVAGVAAMYLHKQPLLSPDDIKEKLKNDSMRDKIDFAYFTDEAKELTPNLLLQTKGGCGGMYPYRTHLNITSPNYPGDYPPSLLCEWKIMGEPQQEITVTILDLDLERNYDYLLVCDGEACQYDNVKARYTGELANLSDTELTVRSSSNHMSILLRTDVNGGGRGFMATFTKFYQGTPLVVKDSGKYLNSQPSPTHRPTRVTTVIGVKTADAKEVISNWSSAGYGISWIDLRKNQSTEEWFYDFLLHNSTVHASRGFVEVDSAEVERLVQAQKEQGFVTEQIVARYGNPEQLLYGIVFKKRSHLIESSFFNGLNLYTSVVRRGKLQKAGWTIICHHVLSSSSGDNEVKISAVFHRDKRRRYGIQLGLNEPNTLLYYGFSFYQFTTVTLALGVQNFYPRYVSSYYPEGEMEASLSVIYEERVPDTTFFNWFRWGLNATEVKRDVVRFSESWSPVLLSSYVYSGSLAHMVVWAIKID